MFRASFRAVRATRIDLHTPPMARVGGAVLLGPISALFVRYNSSIKNTLTDFDAPAEIALNIPPMTSDQIGYLHLIGLAEGWGPTAIIERILEATHVYTGLPWWATIIATTVGIRLAMFPIYVKASDNAAKMTKVKPELDAVLEEMKNAADTKGQMIAAAKRKKIMKDNGLQLLHQFFPLLQLPVAYGFFQATRKMAAYPVEGFQTGGTAWFTDLSAVDPYIGLQLIATAVVIMMVRRGGETGAHQMKPVMQKVMTWVPIASLLVTRSFAALIVLYFAANGLFSFFQTLVLRLAWFRRFANLPKLPPPPPAGSAAEGPTTIKEWWVKFNEDANRKAQTKLKTTNEKVGAISKKKQMASAARDLNFVKKH